MNETMSEDASVAEDQPQSEQTQTDTPKDVPLPDPTLLSLASGLAAQAMISLGVFPNPVDGSVNILIHQGKHLIDTVALLDEKTRGNQTEEETKTFANLLHELRMIFVAAQNEVQRRQSESQNS